MAHLVERLAEARTAVDVAWSTRDELRMVAAIERRRRHRARVRAVALWMPVAMLLVVSGFALRHRSSLHLATTLAAPDTVTTSAASEGAEGLGRIVRLEDGSSATLLQANSELVLAHAEPDDVKLRLDRGAAAFDVVPSTSRTFRVESAGIEVIVLGTAFTVERRPDVVAIAVQRGRVRVIDASGGDTVLAAGESHAFTAGRRDSQEQPGGALAPGAAAEDTPGSGATLAAEGASPRAAGATASSSTWRTLAERGEFEKAYGQLAHAGRTAVRDDDVQGLLLAADAARLSGHPADALSYLRQVTGRHRRDPRSALAAFTLGRVLLTQLGRPREAAVAFADAQRLAPEGSLVEDALAREVEAWYRAGSVDQVNQRSAAYLSRFPGGRWAAAVRQYAGAE